MKTFQDTAFEFTPYSFTDILKQSRVNSHAQATASTEETNKDTKFKTMTKRTQEAISAGVKKAGNAITNAYRKTEKYVEKQYCNISKKC